jgi:hypothetical protein
MGVSTMMLFFIGLVVGIGLLNAPLEAAVQLAYNGFVNMGLGFFMLIFGSLAAIMIWVFDRW